MGFIEDYQNFILEHIPTSDDWAESIATAILSTVLPKQKILSRMGALRLNVWFLDIGASGLAYKSLPLRYFAIPTLEKISENLNVSLILPSRFSVEGMIEYLSQTQSQGLLIRDEFTGMFKESGKQYLQDIMEFMSELYDGMMQKRYTKKAKLESTKRVYVSMISATTPYLFKILKPEFFVQGTGNRILYIYTDASRIGGINPDDFFFGIRKEEEKENQIHKYSKLLLLLLNKTKIRNLSPMKESGERWIEYKISKDTEAKKQFTQDFYDLGYSYIARMPEMVLKLSGLYAVSRSYSTLSQTNLEELIINEEDIDWAIKKVERHYGHFNKLLQLWRTRPEPLEPKTMEEQTNYVLDLLQGKPNGATWGELRKSVRWDIRVWKEVIKYLWDTDQIRAGFKSSPTKGGRPVIIIFHKKHPVTGVQTTIDGWEALIYRLGLE